MTALVALLVIAPSTLVAAPKGKPAKAAFDRGVAAYTRRDWPAAADALAKSYELEPDVETLFAWAQAERQQDHCDKAIELYDKLLDQKLPEANRKVIVTKSDECKAIIAATKPPPAPEPPPTPAPAKPKLDPVEEPVIVAKPAPAHGSPWWKDPIGDGLVGVGLIALGTGGYFLMSASSASSDAKASTNYFETERLNDKADSQGKKGVIASVVGGALILGGIVRYATRSGGNRETTTVSGWITPDSGGITALGRF